MKKLLWPLLLSMVLLNCKQDTASSPKEKPIGVSYDLIFYDTLVLDVPTANIKLTGKQGGQYVGYDIDNYDVFVFSESGRVSSKFNRKGEGPEEYKLIRKAGFLSEDKLVVFDDTKAQVYRKDGTFLWSCGYRSVSDIWPNPGDNIVCSLNDTTVIISSSGNYSPEQKEYFEKTQVGSVIELKSCSIANFGGYDENSLYIKSDKHYIPLYGVKTCYIPSRQEYAYVFQLDPRIFLYSLKNRKESIIQTYPEFFEEPYGSKEFDPSTQLVVLQKNSYYRGIAADNDFLYLLYVKKKDDGELFDNPYDKGTMDEVFVNRDMYLDIYDYSGNKLTQDILVSNTMIDLLAAPSKDSLMFVKTIEVEDKVNMERKAIILGKLVKTD